MNENRNFWKQVSKANEGKVENSNGINDGIERLALEEAEVQRIWKEYCGDLYDIDVHTCVAFMVFGEAAE